jgi:hypothetical protein
MALSKAYRDAAAAVREALWGKPGGFDATHLLYQAIKAVATVRASRPALRYGRHFRPIAGDRSSRGGWPLLNLLQRPGYGGEANAAEADR